jgi:hypothetical protein
MKAIDIYEVCLGFDHPETADAYTKMGLAYQVISYIVIIYYRNMVIFMLLRHG